MRLDNTIFSIYSKCPKMYFERYEADQSDVQRPRIGQEARGISEEAPGSGELLHPLVVPPGGGSQGPFNILKDPIGPDGREGTRQVNKGIELDSESEGRDFGSRLHQLLDERRRQRMGLQVSPVEEWPNEAIESEAQATLAAYEAHWVRDYEYLESEQTHTLPLPILCPNCNSGQHTVDGLPAGRYRCQGSPEGCGTLFSRHELIVKLDAVVRHLDGTIGPMDTKSESRPGYNTREDWAGKTQAKIYLYALEHLYPHERVSRLVVDVVTRRSPKANREPLFNRLDDISSTPAEIHEAIRNVIWVAHDIEESRRRNWWRSNMNMCKRGWEKCDFYALHVNGRTAGNLRKYRPAEQYLDL